MNNKSIESRIRELFYKARILEKEKASLLMHFDAWEDQRGEDKSPPLDWLLEEDSRTSDSFQYIATSIYMSVVCYLDFNNLNDCLRMFYGQFGENATNPKDINEFNINYDYSEEPHSVYLQNIWQFISVFPAFKLDSRQDERFFGIKFLRRVLDNTATIISKSGKTPTSEVQVYKAVKNVLEAIFPTSKSGKSNFLQTAKEYKPDILTPELKAAVEYKYAKTEDKLKLTIEQIAADVKGYTGDNDYKIFFAVFYVTEDFWGSQKFEEVWAEQKFPENWVAYYEVGKGK